MPTQRVVIVGAGLGGSLLAILLGRADFAVEVFERRPDPRQGAVGRARSINLALSTRGLHALDQAGLKQQILDLSVPMPGRMIHDRQGRTTFQPYGTAADQAIYSMSRSALNMALVEAAEARGVRFHFGRRCTDVDLQQATATFVEADSGASESISANLIVGGDGASSQVRAAIERAGRFDYAQSYLEHGYKELTIPPADGGGFRIEPHALHIWPRGGHMTIALPNPDGSFTVTCFWPFSGPHGFAQLVTPADVLRYFQEQFPDAVPLLPQLTDEFFRNPTSDLVTIRCWPWRVADRVVLLGDAAHAIVPFYGEGANAAFEDGVVLARCLVEHPGDRARALDLYQHERKANADALADLALRNFVEMRDKTASRVFLWGKKLEKGLARLLPFWFRPLYSMVKFSHTPYAEAVARAQYQWRVVRWVGVGLGLLLLLCGWSVLT